MPDKRTILIAGMGTSPAVLTETVWALCHQEKPTVPLCSLSQTLWLPVKGAR